MDYEKIMDYEKVDAVFHTSGTGLWSGKSKAVKIVAFSVDTPGLPGIPELRVWFDTESWNIMNGLIYTDPQFEHEVQQYLLSMGFSEAAAEVDYSEHGMQGRNYVSFDAPQELAVEWRRRHFLVFA